MKRPSLASLDWRSQREGLGFSAISEEERACSSRSHCPNFRPGSSTTLNRNTPTCHGLEASILAARKLAQQKHSRSFRRQLTNLALLLTPLLGCAGVAEFGHWICEVLCSVPRQRDFPHELATFRIWKLETVPVRLRSGLLESQSQYPEREGVEPVRREPDSHRTLRRLRRSPPSTPPAKVKHLQQCPGTHP